MAQLDRHARQNPRDSRFASALFQTARSYEGKGELSRALQLYRLIARMGGPLAGKAKKRIEVLQRRMKSGMDE